MTAITKNKMNQTVKVTISGAVSMQEIPVGTEITVVHDFGEWSLVHKNNRKYAFAVDNSQLLFR